MKTYHFLAGLPRSGNTLLSSLLNQNPDIYSSPLSPICGYMWELHKSLGNRENNFRNDFTSRNMSVMSKIMDNFYYDVDKPIIFDREKSWATPGNLDVIKKYITPTPKIIFTVRPILEILASFLTITSENQMSYIDEDMISTNWWYKDYLSRNENRCDFLMRPYGMIDQVLFSFNEIRKKENKDIFHLVEYNDLVQNPDEVMDGIYEFLGIEKYQHNFNNIVKLEEDKDSMVGMPKDMHKIRKSLSKTSLPVEKILSEYTIQKYGNIKFSVKNEK